MAYTNEVEPLYVEGGSWPPLFARIWEVIRTVNGGPPTRIQAINEEVTVPGGGRRPFTLVSGPSLPAPALCGLTLHDTAPGMTGPLFRFGDIDVLPTPFPTDPAGYVSYVALGPLDLDATTVAARDRPFTWLPRVVDGDTVTGLTITGGADSMTL